MPTKQSLTGSGVPALTSNEFAGRGSTGLVATGTNQATALPINGNTNTFSTVASGTGCALGVITSQYGPTLTVGDSIYVANMGANALLIYPPVGGGENINALSVDAPFSLAAGKLLFLKKVTPTTWYTMLSA